MRKSHIHIFLQKETACWTFALCTESGGGGLGTWAVQAAGVGRRAGACGWDAAAAAGAGAVQCLWGDDPPPGAGEGTPACAPGVRHACYTFPWHSPHSRHPSPFNRLPHHPAEPRGLVRRHQPPTQSSPFDHWHTCHGPAQLWPLTQAWIFGQPREQQWVNLSLTQGAGLQRI